MKIAVIGTRGFPDIQGGVEKHCEELYTRLVALGLDVTVITRAGYVKNKNITYYKGVMFAHIFSPKLKSLEAISHTFLAMFKLKKLKPDIVHVHSIGPSLLIPLIKLFGYKVVMTHHGPDYMRKKWGPFAKLALKKGESNAVKYSDAVICVGNWIKFYIKKKYGRETYFIPNGIAVSQNIKDAHEYIKGNNDTLKKFGLIPCKYIITVGRFVPEKAADDLINAYKLLNNPPFKLVIAGGADHETPYSLKIKKLADETPGVVMTGTVYKDVLRDLYINAVLFVLPSHYEGFPISLLEALILGVPALVSDIPAHNEIKLSDFRYFKAGNIQGLSSKISQCVDIGMDKNERVRYLEIIKNDYDWDGIALKTLDVYKTIMKPR